MKKETKLQKAKRLYPIGTKIRCAYNGDIGTRVSKNIMKQDDDLYFEDEDGNAQYVLNNGIWATRIIKKNKGYEIY